MGDKFVEVFEPHIRTIGLFYFETLGNMQFAHVGTNCQYSLCFYLLRKLWPLYCTLLELPPWSDVNLCSGEKKNRLWLVYTKKIYFSYVEFYFVWNFGHIFSVNSVNHTPLRGNI